MLVYREADSPSNSKIRTSKCPLLGSRLAVVRLREDVGQPANGQVAVGQPLVQMMVPQVLVQGFGDLDSTHHPQQQRDVVDPFLFGDKWLRLHAPRCSHSSFPWLSFRE